MPALPADWYDTPLYYDIIFDQDTGKEATFLQEVFLKHAAGIKGSAWNIIEPACGSGRLVAELARRGHAVSGFDLNPRMLGYAQDRLRQEKLKARLWEDRLESFTLPSRSPHAGFDLAHCLVSTFKYIAHEVGAVSHLHEVAQALRRGGLYVLGLHLTDYSYQREEHERWVNERDGIHVVCNTHTWPAQRRLRKEKLRNRLRITRDGHSWTQETHWEFRTYNAAEMKRLLATAPSLECVACYDFSYDIHSPRELDDSYADVILVLRKT